MASDFYSATSIGNIFQIDLAIGRTACPKAWEPQYLLFWTYLLFWVGVGMLRVLGAPLLENKKNGFLDFVFWFLGCLVFDCWVLGFLVWHFPRFTTIPFHVFVDRILLWCPRFSRLYWTGRRFFFGVRLFENWQNWVSQILRFIQTIFFKNVSIIS